MTDYEPYSARQTRAAKEGLPITYVLGPIPHRLRAQAFQIVEKLGGARTIDGRTNLFWTTVEKSLTEAHGYFGTLPNSGEGSGAYYRVRTYFAYVEGIDEFIDAIEIGMREAQQNLLSRTIRPISGISIDELIQRVVELLNRRFGQYDLGYAFVGTPGTIIRLEDQFLHSDVVEPAIARLNTKGWHGPLDEFMNAHKYYRHGDNKSAKNEALKSFESTMKAILTARSWHYDQNWTASKLIKALFENGLLPAAMESYFGAIKAVLEGGVPTLRNQRSAHGQGDTVIEVPEYFAAFVLHLTASNIVFLMSAHEDSNFNAHSLMPDVDDQPTELKL